MSNSIIFLVVMTRAKHNLAIIGDIRTLLGEGSIESRGYKPLLMSPYSSFLNPIEECWSKIKRNPLSLTPRVKAACETITTKDCSGWIPHSETYWDTCLNKED